MLFRFLKYVQPTRYFQLQKLDGNSVFPEIEELSPEIQSALLLDTGFMDPLAQEYDRSWQAIQLGYVGQAKTFRRIKTLPLQDEYRFLRKYFHPLWSVYVLAIRLLGLQNPFKEIRAYWDSRNVGRSSYMKRSLEYSKWDTFQSALLASNPLVSVIIPTLNRYDYLKDVLSDLEQQDYPNFEVIVVDQSEPFQEEFYSDYTLDLRIIHQEEKALWLARNTAIRQSHGELYLLFDDDSRVEADWIRNHLKCLDFFEAHLSSGVSISKVGDKIPENYRFFRISDQLDTGNVLIKKEVFQKVGLFDRQFEKQRMGDGEFGLRAYLAGFRNISNPYAERLHLKVGTGGLRQMGSWDGFRPKNWMGPRPIPSVLYFYRKYYGNARARWSLLKTVPPSIMPYRFKKNKKLLFLGIFISIVLSPIVLIQVYRSWQLSSDKLKQGPLINEID